MNRTTLASLLLGLFFVTLPSFGGDHGCSAKTMQTNRVDIVDTAVSAGDFKTLVAAVKAAGLVETLKGPGPYTVFAPTDKAFRMLHQGSVQSLLRPENRNTLTQILTYHVVPGKLTAEDVTELSGAKTVQGKLIKFRSHNGGSVQVNHASVVKADIETSNGIIHVIDSVLMP
jgi:uncharacterized surface protein with fasciclin (FAS1) repeats